MLGLTRMQIYTVLSEAEALLGVLPENHWFVEKVET